LRSVGRNFDIFTISTALSCNVVKLLSCKVTELLGTPPISVHPCCVVLVARQHTTVRVAYVYEDWSDDGARDECVGHVDSLRPGTWLLLREHGHSPSPTTPLPTPPPLPEITVSDISSSSSYLPNNTTVCAFASIQFRRAGQQGPTRTLKRVIKQVHSITQIKYYK